MLVFDRKIGERVSCRTSEGEVVLTLLDIRDGFARLRIEREGLLPQEALCGTERRGPLRLQTADGEIQIVVTKFQRRMAWLGLTVPLAIDVVREEVRMRRQDDKRISQVKAK